MIVADTLQNLKSLFFFRLTYEKHKIAYRNRSSKIINMWRQASVLINTGRANSLLFNHAKRQRQCLTEKYVNVPTAWAIVAHPWGMSFATKACQSAKHPLDPLTAEEIKSASSTVKNYLADKKGRDPSLVRFVSVSLHEPEKSILIEANENEQAKIGRKAEIVTLLDGMCSELVVDLEDVDVVEHVDLPSGTQPLFSPDDCDFAEEIVKSSTDVQKAVLVRYGIKDIQKELVCDPWSVHLADEKDKSLTTDEDTGLPRRLIQTFLYQRMLNIDTLEDNHYAHPIDIVPVVDLNTGKVVRIDGMDRPPPKIPDLSVNYHPNLLSTNSYLQRDWRQQRLRELNVVQPDGPSFQVDGNFVSWQDWSFRIGFNYREGLILHDVKYQGRNVVHRASLVEMAVPYGDPHPPFQRKCAFDVGDYGLGYCANSLELGCDW